MVIFRAFAFLVCLASGLAVNQCPGSVVVNENTFQVVATQRNMPTLPAGAVKVLGDSIQPEMWGRAYLADRCLPGKYNNTDYASLHLLGKKLLYTTDVSRAGCGCNVALYLVSMEQNHNPSGCDDFYCDANNVCGVRCDEIDIQEANKFAWHSAVHTSEDGNGLAVGLGGWVRNNHFEMTPEQYGPGGLCIDTTLPFRVEVAFPINSKGMLLSMEYKLVQDGKPCDVSYSLTEYQRDPNFEQLSQSLAVGMTVAFSYWKAEDMLWLDGPGLGGGPCLRDDMACGAAPSFSDFEVVDLGDSIFYP